MPADTSAAPTPPLPGAPPPSPKALLFFLSGWTSYRNPIFSPNEVFCGPDTETRSIEGRLRTFRGPTGSFDIAEVLKQIPQDQQPELLIVKADASARNFPRHLDVLTCPKVLIVGDTHHMTTPLQRMIGYAQSERFDRIIFDHTRHHAHLFASAGCRNLHWIPAVDYGFVPRPMKAKPSHALTFVGQVGRYHPYRKWLLDQVSKAGLPLEILGGTLVETANYYSDSQVTLNISLNGDLNLRIFESLAAGGFLLTDALSEASGLPLLFEAGQHLDCYRSPGELIEKIRHYLNHPEEVHRIRREGHAELLRAHHPDIKLREFYDLVYSGRENPRYVLTLERRFRRALEAPESAPIHAIGFEIIQDLHRSALELRLCTDSETDCADLLDLPRLRLRPLSAVGLTPTEEPVQPAELIVFHGSDPAPLEAVLPRYRGRCLFATASTSVALRAGLAAWGFAPDPRESSLFRLTDPRAWLAKMEAAGSDTLIADELDALLEIQPGVESLLAISRSATRLGMAGLCEKAFLRILDLDRGCAEALRGLARFARVRGESLSALFFLEESSRLAPLPTEDETVRKVLSQELLGTRELSTYMERIRKTPHAACARPRRILVLDGATSLPPFCLRDRLLENLVEGLSARAHELQVLKNEGSAEELIARYETALDSFKPEFVLAGNLALLGSGPLKLALARGHHVIHLISDEEPGYPPAETPSSPSFVMAPCSDWLCQELLRKGYRLGTLRTIPPGICVADFFRLHPPSTQGLRFCFAGSISPDKGLEDFIKALILLSKNGVAYKAVIAGSAPDPDYLEQLKQAIVRVGLQGAVLFEDLPDLNALVGVFNRSNVIIVPSTCAEPVGIVQLEAMAAGLVVVTSGTGGAGELVQHGKNGIHFKAGDCMNLATHLMVLARHPDTLRTLQAAVLARAEAYSVTKTAMSLEQTMAG